MEDQYKFLERFLYLSVFLCEVQFLFFGDWFPSINCEGKVLSRFLFSRRDWRGSTFQDGVPWKSQATGDWTTISLQTKLPQALCITLEAYEATSELFRGSDTWYLSFWRFQELQNCTSKLRLEVTWHTVCQLFKWFSALLQRLQRPFSKPQFPLDPPSHRDIIGK